MDTRRLQTLGLVVALGLGGLALWLRFTAAAPSPGPVPRAAGPSPAAGLDPGELSTAIRGAGLDGRAQAIATLARPALRLSTGPADEASLAAGASRLGGAPDVPEGFVWPEWKGKPLSFLAQLNLAELRQGDSGRALPEQGLLSFFYDQEQRTWGFDPADRESWRVFHFTEASLRKREPPAGASFPARAIAASPETSLPDLETYGEQLGLADAQEEAYFGLVDELAGEGPRHRLLGHPDPVQGSMPLEVQLASNGLNTGDSKGYDDPRRQALEAGASQWKLLLQLDSDDGAQMMWGDSGRLYFWIREDDLRSARFDDVWMVLQCY